MIRPQDGEITGAQSDWKCSTLGHLLTTSPNDSRPGSAGVFVFSRTCTQASSLALPAPARRRSFSLNVPNICSCHRATGMTISTHAAQPKLARRCPCRSWQQLTTGRQEDLASIHPTPGSRRFKPAGAIGDEVGRCSETTTLRGIRCNGLFLRSPKRPTWSTPGAALTVSM